MNEKAEEKLEMKRNLFQEPDLESELYNRVANRNFRRAVGAGVGRRGNWEQCVRDDMRLLGLHSEWVIFKDMWRDLIWGKCLTLA